MATIASERRLAAPVASLRARDTGALLPGATIYLICFAILTVLAFSADGFFSTDDYYHARISEQIIIQGRLGLEFPWLPLTILSPDKFVDHHLLYHIVLAPFVYFMDDMTGAKIATVALAAGGYLAIWILLRNIGVRYPGLWTLGTFGMSATFVIRALMIRTQGFSFLLLVLALIVMIQRRHQWLILLGFLYVWLYNGFILMLGFAACYTLAAWLTDRKLLWQPMAFCALGLALGIVINPYFPRNVAFVLDHLGAKVDLDNSIPLGSEWSAFNTRTWLTALTGSIVAMVLGFVRPYFGGGKRDRIETALLLVALLTGFMAFYAMRFLEYFPGFALLFWAAAWGRSPVIQLDWAPFRRFARFLVPLILVVALGVFAVNILQVSYDVMSEARPAEEYLGSGTWLDNNTPDGTLVYPVGFNDFAKLFFYNQTNRWLIGLDPTYLQYVNAEWWNLYDRIRNGQIERPSEVIASTWGIQYIISAERHEAFNRVARQDPNLDLVFRDRFTSVWKVDDAYFEQARPQEVLSEG